MPNAISACIAGIHKISDALPGPQNRLVHFAAFRVASPSLHVALEEMMIHRVQHDWGTCAPAALSKKMNPGGRVSAGKSARTVSIGKVAFDVRRDFGVENTLGFDLQLLLLVTSEKSAMESCKMTSAKPILRCNSSST